MKTAVTVLVLAGVTALAAAASSSPSSSGADAQIFNRPGVLWHYGYVRSLAAKGSGYELRFDPALWLAGVTANRAAEQDGVIKPGEGVPNDYYVRNDRRRALTFLVPAHAKATVLTTSRQIRSTRIPLAELAEIVKGRNPKQRPLLDRGNRLGFWIAVRVDRVRSLDQQYQP